MLFSRLRNISMNLLGHLTWINRLWMTMNGCKIGKNFKCYGMPFIKNNRGVIIVGDNVRMNSATWPNPIGYYPRICFQIQPQGQIIIGNNVGMSSCALSCFERIEIKNNVLIGAGVKIYDTDFHPIDPIDRKDGNNNNICHKPIIIDENSFIGAGTVVLKGVHIGKNVVVGAGSVVTKSIPDNEVWAGNPARYIKKLMESMCENGTRQSTC